MIEMVYSSKETEELNEVRVPKNIRQIGDSKSDRKIYVEDYVMTNLKKKPDNEEDVKYGVLLGEIKRAKGNTYVFVKGMVETREIIENSIIFNDDTWASIYKDIKTYFDGFEIIGWFVSVPYTVKNDMSSIQKIHLDNFAGNDKVCYLNDRTENEDGFFSYEDGNLKKQLGYYIFYEKNEKMKKYLKQTQGSRGIAVSVESDHNKNADISDKKVKIRSVVDEKQKSRDKVNAVMKSSAAGEVKGKEKSTVSDTGNDGVKQHVSFRDLIKQQVSEESNGAFKPGRMAYGISSMLIIALLLSTVVMLNNYGELKSLKASIENMNGDGSVEAVNEILSVIAPTTSETTESVSSDEAANSQMPVQNETAITNETQAPTDNNVDNNSGEIDDAGNEAVEVQPNNEMAEEDDGEAAAGIYSGMYHTVTEGQTLYDISMAYYGNSSMVDKIKELNAIDDDYLIKEGQKLLLP